MASKVKLADTLRLLVKDLEAEDQGVRPLALVRVWELGTQAKPASLAVIACLAGDAEADRFKAYQFIAECYPAVQEHPGVVAKLSSDDPEVRLPAIRELITLLPEVREAIAAQRLGWRELKALTEPAGGDRTSRVRPGKAPHAASGSPEPVTEDAMQNAKKSKSQGGLGAEDPVRMASEAMLAPQAHLIRIVDQEARRRAITVLGRAQQPYCGFTDYRLLVTDEHLGVLKREAIPFEVVS